MTNEDFEREFHERRVARLTKGWETYPLRNPIASDLSECFRYMVLRMIAWELRPHPDINGLQVIEQGREAEPIMIRQMQNEGWEIVQQQTSFTLETSLPDGRRLEIMRGKIDGQFVLSGADGKREYLPFDCKDTSEFTLASYVTEHDLYKNEWSRKWLRQAVAYMLCLNVERFVFVLGHRGTRKLVFVHLDQHLELGEEIMKLCERAVLKLEELKRDGNATPEKADAVLGDYHGDYSVCRSCWLRNLACFPPEPARSRTVSVQPSLEPIVAEYLELKPKAARYDKLHAQIQEHTEGSPTVVAGPYVVEGEVKTRHMKAQPAKPEHRQEFWQFKARRVGE